MITETSETLIYYYLFLGPVLAILWIARKDVFEILKGLAIIFFGTLFVLLFWPFILIYLIVKKKV